MFSFRARDINVVGDNNTLLYGRVVDVADNGLYIDLLCPKRHREFFPFNRVFLSLRCLHQEWMWDPTEEPRQTIAVEVLRREDPSGTWRWWPGLVITPARKWDSSFWCRQWEECRVAVVQGREDSGAIWTDIVPRHCLRYPVPSDWWIDQRDMKITLSAVTHLWHTGPGRFVKWSMPPLPAECREVSAEQLLQLIKEMDEEGAAKGHVVSVDVADGEVQCVVELNEGVGDTEAQEILQPLHNMLTLRLPQVLRDEAETVERGMVDGFPVLSVDVWQEVFAHLDTVTQTRLRAVHPKWKDILDKTAALTANIIIETSGGLRNFHYFMTAPIFECLRPSTKRVIIHDRERRIRWAELLTVLDMIDYVARTHPGIRLTGLYVVGVTKLLSESGLRDEDADPKECDVHPPSDLFGRPRCYSGLLDDLIVARRDLPCDAIHLVRCRVRVRYDVVNPTDVEGWTRRRCVQLDVDMALTRLPLSGDWASNVWQAVESALPVPSGDEMQALSAWLTEVTADERRQFQRIAVCKVLCMTQTGDPRSSLHYRGKKWCADGLQGLRLEKLSRIAQRFLVILPEFLRKRRSGSPVSSDSD
ncbi:uncharacterized protein LOC129582855 [Paramacrobiotus metropolitanus]|uniref:uncharacterized protein LOC129582855 n=1 Tax=Paramacrobiotus metropolitanus TaxID=2943436 RepID=UPI0024460C0F|nr:uncharacterized protein LOC129582855 [Paramacrobiotus metropolitanus]